MLNNLFQEKLDIINVGLEGFSADLNSQDFKVLQVDWRVPNISEEAKSLLDQLAFLDDEEE